MPFRSEAQRRYLYSQHPEVAREFASKTPKGKKLPEHVGKAKRKPLVGKMGNVHGATEFVTLALVGKLAGTRGAGAAGPHAPVSPLPDFNDIFYQPTNPDNEQRERDAEIARRRSMADRNKGVFGLHGVPPPEPVLRYAPEDHVLVVRAKKNDRSVIDGKHDNANAFPLTPKVEGREVEGTRFVYRDPGAARREAGVPMQGKATLSARVPQGPRPEQPKGVRRHPFGYNNQPKGPQKAMKNPPGTAKPEKFVIKEPKPPKPQIKPRGSMVE